MPVRIGSTWLVVGSALSAPRYFDQALALADVTITCNAGIYLWLTADPPAIPTYYWLSDSQACELFPRCRRFVQKRGSKIITLARSPGGLAIRDLDSADLLLDLPERPELGPAFIRGQWIHPVLSGLICLQFALNHGPGKLICVGMNGYKSKPGEATPDTFDGRSGKPNASMHTREWIQPFTQSAVSACPDVKFIFAGKLQYELTGRNVVMVDDPAALWLACQDCEQPSWQHA